MASHIPFPDDWAASFQSATAPHLHVYGAINFEWQRCEFEIFALMAALAATPANVLKTLMAGVDTAMFPAKVKTLTKARGPPKEIGETIERLMNLAEACRENRDALMNAMPYLDEESASPAYLLFYEEGPENKITLSLTQMRQVCDQIRLCRLSIEELLNFFAKKPNSSMPVNIPAPIRLALLRHANSR
jgi:hypothetical protein